MIYIHYWLLFFTNDNFKYPITSQRVTFNSVLLFYIFSVSFLLCLFKVSCTKNHHVYNLYHISHTLSFWYVMCYIVLEICIGGRLLEDCFIAIAKNYICCSYWITNSLQQYKKGTVFLDRKLLFIDLIFGTIWLDIWY